MLIKGMRFKPLTLRYMVIAASLAFLAGLYCLPPVKSLVNTAIVIAAGRLGIDNYRLAWYLDVPLDEAMAQRPRVGRYKEYVVEDPDFDVLIYDFDGSKGDSQSDVARAGLKAIQKHGFNHKKEMTLLVFCNLASRTKAHNEVFPFGLFLNSAAIREAGRPIADLLQGPFIPSPMKWDDRIKNWVYAANDANRKGPEITENPKFTSPTRIERVPYPWEREDLTNRMAVRAKFGEPRFFVSERGSRSEIYLVDEGTQAGTFRVWYEGEIVTNTGCCITNK